MLPFLSKLEISKKLLDNLLFVFCLLLPFQFALNPYPGIDLAVARIYILVFFVVFIFHQIKNKSLALEKNLVTILISMFLLLVFFSLSFSQNLAWSFRKILFIFSIAPIYYISYFLLNSEQKVLRVFSYFVFGAFILSLLAISQFVMQFILGIDPVYDFLAKHVAPFFLGNSFSQMVSAYPSWLVAAGSTTYMRAVANFPDPHMLSYYLGMLLPWSLFVASKKAPENKLYYLIPLFIFIADIFTFTRGAYIALIAAAIVTLPLVSKDVAKKILLGIFTLLLLLQIIPNNPIGDRFSSSFDPNEGSNAARFSNWQQALTVIKENPFGIGIGTYPLEINPSAAYREPIYAHNLYLDIAAEIGVHAALVFMSLLFFVAKQFWKNARINFFFVPALASITVFSVHSLVETPLYSVHILPLFFVTIAIAANIKNYGKN